MATSADINPNFITTAAVSKQGMRQQLQYIKEALAAQEALGGWRLLSDTYLLTPQQEVRCNLPTGWLRYRIEFQDVRGDGSAGQLNLRGSANDGVTMLTGNEYFGPLNEWNAAGSLVHAAGTGSYAQLSANIGHAYTGAFGYLEFVSQRNRFELSVNYQNASGDRYCRRGFVSIDSSIITQVQFYLSGFSPNFATGTRFTVMAR